MKLLYSIILSAGIAQGSLWQYAPIKNTLIEEPIYATMSCDVQLGPFFGVAKIRADMFVEEIDNYSPWQNTYSVGCGVRIGFIEAGLIRTCYHPMQPYQWTGEQITPSFEGAVNDFYVSLKLSNR